MESIDFDRIMLAAMPHYVALNYQRLLEATTPQEQLEAAARLYDLVLRSLTINAVSQYLIRDRERVYDPYLNELLLRDFPHLTLDACQRLLFSSLRAYEGQQALLFMPELYDLYWDTSVIPHRRHIKIELTFDRMTQIAMEIKTKRLLPSSEERWCELAEEAAHLLRQVLQTLSFLQDYHLVRIVDWDDASYNFELHRGLRVSTERLPLPDDVRLHTGWFYLRRGVDFLLLHPLLIFWEGEPNSSDLPASDTGLYGRFIYDRLQYLLAEHVKTVHDNSGVKAFVALLFDTIEEVKRKRQEADKLTWWQLRDICGDVTRVRMATMRLRYSPELYLQRTKPHQAFAEFLESEARCFVLIGRSGVGKSNFLLALADELSQHRSDIVVLMYDGAHLDTEPSLTASISKDLDERLVVAGHKVQDVWREIARVDEINQRLVLLFVDAINESRKAQELLRQLDALVQGPWSWLRVVFSCRPETWHEIRRGVKLAEALYFKKAEAETFGVELEPFSCSAQMETFSRQELPEAYAKYQQIFHLQTPYANVRRELREILQEPLNLWLVSKTYEGQAVPDEIKVTQLVEQYVGALLTSGRLEQQDLELLEKQLVPLMASEKHYTNTITIGDLDSAGEGLYETIFSEQKLSNGRRMNQSFVNLLDADILVKRLEGRTPRIAFKYERLYEYFVGQRLVELAKAQPNRLDFYSDMLDKMSIIPFLWGAVKNALTWSARDEPIETIIGLCFTKQERAKEMMVAALTELGQEDPSRVTRILTSLLEPADHRAFSRRLRDLFLQKRDDAAAVNAKKTAAEVASQLGLGSILALLSTDSSTNVRGHVTSVSFVQPEAES